MASFSKFVTTTPVRVLDFALYSTVYRQYITDNHETRVTDLNCWCSTRADLGQGPGHTLKKLHTTNHQSPITTAVASARIYICAALPVICRHMDPCQKIWYGLEPTAMYTGRPENDRALPALCGAILLGHCACFTICLFISPDLDGNRAPRKALTLAVTSVEGVQKSRLAV